MSYSNVVMFITSKGKSIKLQTEETFDDFVLPSWKTVPITLKLMIVRIVVKSLQWSQKSGVLHQHCSGLYLMRDDGCKSKPLLLIFVSATRCVSLQICTFLLATPPRDRVWIWLWRERLLWSLLYCRQTLCWTKLQEVEIQQMLVDQCE